MVKDFYQKTKIHFSIYDENIQLKKDLKKQLSTNYNIEFILAENKRLKETIEEIKFSNEDVYAKVLLDKDSPFLKSFIINKGSKQKIKLGMAVLDKGYLVGKIIEVNFSTSRVLLLTDLNSKIPVNIEPGGIQSIMSGTGKEYGEIQYFKNQKNISEDSIVYTSGAGGVFKSGIPIGKIKLDENKDVQINYFTDFSQLRFVKISIYDEVN